MNPNIDYQSLYRTITNKLKKRFFKKPNISEAGDSFANLAKMLKNEECPEYAAVFTLGQARCEAALNNPSGEASCLLSAGKLFLEAEDALKAINAITIQENLDCAVMCFGKAVKIYEDIKLYTMAASVSLCLADSLKRHQKYSEACIHYQKAAELLAPDSLRLLNALKNFSHCQIKLRNFAGALGTFVQMQRIVMNDGGSPLDGRPFGAFADYLLASEIYRVLLVLLVDPPPEKPSKEDSGFTLDHYILESNSRGGDSVQFSWMDDELFLLLQSLVLACRARSVQTVERLCSDLQIHMDYEQREILMELVDELVNPSGEAF